jgi:uncharacterized protein (DUF1697 family)
LRGINVSNRRATSDQLCSCLTEVGSVDVATFRASGNVIFSVEGDDHREDELAGRIEEVMLSSLGYEVPVFLRTEAEVLAIARHEPFPAERVRASAGKLQVTLLGAEPAAAAREEVLALASDDDALEFRGRELYWLPSGGTMESALDMNVIGKILGLGTMRTKGTIEQIAAKYF